MPWSVGAASSRLKMERLWSGPSCARKSPAVASPGRNRGRFPTDAFELFVEDRAEESPASEEREVTRTVNEILAKLVQENALDEDGARIVHDAITRGKPFDDALRDAPNLVEDKAL